MKSRIAVIGAGAAGFFAAIHAAMSKDTEVILFEKSNKVLAKVRISGGGRCNVMHNCFDVAKLIEYYPRGRKELRNAFARFNSNHTLEWFESRGVDLKIEDDGRMFPVTDDSATIINCLEQEAEKYHVDIQLHKGVDGLKKTNNGFELSFSDESKGNFDKVIITTGGSPNISSYEWLQQLGHTIVSPAPSLFTFNIPLSPLKGLEGLSVQSALVKIKDCKHTELGPVLITHWGISGPAVIKMSAWNARQLQEANYETTVSINWLPEYNIDSIKEVIDEYKMDHGSRKVFTSSPVDLPHRLWERICDLARVTIIENYADLNKKKMNAIAELLVNMQLHSKGKTTYKEEFVTCGGVSLKEVDMQTMESKKVQGLFFAGEVLDIDGITGGFNFQAAWTTGYLAGVNSALTVKN